MLMDNGFTFFARTQLVTWMLVEFQEHIGWMLVDFPL